MNLEVISSALLARQSAIAACPGGAAYPKAKIIFELVEKLRAAMFPEFRAASPESEALGSFSAAGLSNVTFEIEAAAKGGGEPPADAPPCAWHHALLAEIQSELSAEIETALRWQHCHAAAAGGRGGAESASRAEAAFREEAVSCAEEASSAVTAATARTAKEASSAADAAAACTAGEADRAARAASIAAALIEALPAIQRLLYKDAEAGFVGDPAARSVDEVILSYPGFFAVFVYRIAHFLFLQEVPLIPRMMSEYAHSATGIDIHPGAVIGEYFFVDHGTGVVIGETTVIGNHVKLYQGVTLGGLSTKGGQKLAGVRRHPTIEDYVTIYAGATILGGETVIGKNSTIGGNMFITKSVSNGASIK